MKKNKALFCLFFLFAWGAGSFLAQGQDLQFSQYYQNPLFTNPAICGAVPQYRASLLTRYQMPSIGTVFTSSAASFDYNAIGASCGFGGFIQQENMAGKALSVSRVCGQFAYEITLASSRSNAWKARGGMQVGAVLRQYNYNSLFFADQFASGSATAEVFPSASKFYPDFGFGALVYNKFFWFGASYYHITRPDIAVFSSYDKERGRISLHAGARIVLDETYNVYGETEKSISPGIVFDRQFEYTRLQAGCNMQLSALQFGIWYKYLPPAANDPILGNRDEISFLCGFKMEKLGISYSYDIAYGSMSLNGGGSHELAVVYKLHYNQRLPKNGNKFVICPLGN